MATVTFETLFCERFGCLPEQYEGRAFRELLYGHAKVIAPVLRMVTPDFFAEDLRFIRDLGQATDLREANVSAASFQDSNGTRGRFWRKALRIRVSGLKGAALARELFA